MSRACLSNCLLLSVSGGPAVRACRRGFAAAAGEWAAFGWLTRLPHARPFRDGPGISSHADFARAVCQAYKRKTGRDAPARVCAHNEEES